MDDETLKAAFAAHTVGATMFTRRMAINLADAAEMRPMSMVRRLENLKLLPAGTCRWFKINGGITSSHIKQARVERAGFLLVAAA